MDATPRNGAMVIMQARAVLIPLTLLLLPQTSNAATIVIDDEVCTLA